MKNSTESLIEWVKNRRFCGTPRRMYGKVVRALFLLTAGLRDFNHSAELKCFVIAFGSAVNGRKFFVLLARLRVPSYTCVNLIENIFNCGPEMVTLKLITRRDSAAAVYN